MIDTDEHDPNGPAIVGESGPELANLPKGYRIQPGNILFTDELREIILAQDEKYPLSKFRLSRREKVYLALFAGFYAINIYLVLFSSVA